MTSRGFYAHPLYYDILFGWHRAPEVLFYDSLFQKYGLSIGDRLLEVACGTGIVGIDLARLGWSVSGLDISGPMLEFLEEKLGSCGVGIHTIQADMTNFTLSQPCSGALCPLGSFGLLNDDELTVQHLQSLARNMIPGGLYIIDVGLREGPSAPCNYDEIEWAMERGGVLVDARDGVVHINDHGEQKTLEWEAVPTEFNCNHLQELIAQSGCFSIEDWYPEVDWTDEGISLFDMGVTQEPPIPERAMVVLRRL